MFERLHSEFENNWEQSILKLYPNDDILSQACRYALEGKGKRIRPLLVLLSHQLFSENYNSAFLAAQSVEMIHTYSLVHDDLPVMDNDDYRRGRLTVHKKFDEATALLVGDALLSDAFQVLSQVGNPEISSKMVQELSRAIGGSGMVYGQSLDLYWTGKEAYTQKDLEKIHSHKTGKLFSASLAMGAISAKADEKQVQIMREIGSKFGLVYQIIDDLIDNDENIGKTPGKDEQLKKLTYLKLMSKEDVFKIVKELMKDIDALLLELNQSSHLASFLKEILSKSNF